MTVLDFVSIIIGYLIIIIINILLPFFIVIRYNERNCRSSLCGSFLFCFPILFHCFLFLFFFSSSSFRCFGVSFYRFPFPPSHSIPPISLFSQFSTVLYSYFLFMFMFIVIIRLFGLFIFLIQSTSFFPLSSTAGENKVSWMRVFYF
jgi:hypothetical protein